MKTWLFFDRNHGLTLWKNLNVLNFWTFCFYSFGSRCRISYNKSSWLIFSKKKKVEKWPFLDQNHGLTLWKNVNVLTVWTSFFYILELRFLVLEYHERHFPGLYCLKKKSWKMAIFGPKPSVNPFGKMSIFRLFKLLVFIA